MNELQQKQNVIAGIEKNLKKKKWECICPTCHSESINSHLLQQNGILNCISSERYYYELRPASIFTLKKNKPFVEIKRVGITEAISLRLFCNQHDTQLFRQIESESTDFENYTNQLLFCLRTAYSEARKHEIVIEKYKRMLNASSINWGKEAENNMKVAMESTKIGMNEAMIIAGQIEEEISSPSSSFKIVHKVFDKIGIYASAMFSLDPQVNKNPFDSKLTDSVFFHVIPQNDSIHIIIAYNVQNENEMIKDFINYWNSCCQQTLLKQLSGLFASKIESWGLSPEIYDKISKEKWDNFKQKFSDNFEKNDLNIFEEIDLFDEIPY